MLLLQGSTIFLIDHQNGLSARYSEFRRSLRNHSGCDLIRGLRIGIGRRNHLPLNRKVECAVTTSGIESGHGPRTGGRDIENKRDNEVAILVVRQ